MTKQLHSASLKPIAKLFLTGTDRTITPQGYADRHSWLDNIEGYCKEYHVNSKELSQLAKSVGSSVDPMALMERTPLLTESKAPLAPTSAIPHYLFGQIEPNGTLSVVAWFLDEEGNNLDRIGYASISNFEVEWLHPPSQLSNKEAARPTDANQPAELQQ